MGLNIQIAFRVNENSLPRMRTMVTSSQPALLGTDSVFLEVGNDLSVMQPHRLPVCSRPLATVACQAEFRTWSLSMRHSVHPRTSLTLANVGFLLFSPFWISSVRYLEWDWEKWFLRGLEMFSFFFSLKSTHLITASLSLTFKNRFLAFWVLPPTDDAVSHFAWWSY